MPELLTRDKIENMGIACSSEPYGGPVQTFEFNSLRGIMEKLGGTRPFIIDGYNPEDWEYQRNPPRFVVRCQLP